MATPTGKRQPSWGKQINVSGHSAGDLCCRLQMIMPPAVSYGITLPFAHFHISFHYSIVYTLLCSCINGWILADWHATLKAYRLGFHQYFGIPGISTGHSLLSDFSVYTIPLPRLGLNCKSRPRVIHRDFLETKATYACLHPLQKKISQKIRKVGQIESLPTTDCRRLTSSARLFGTCQSICVYSSDIVRPKVCQGAD